MSKFLVIGGTYFTGRVFVIQATRAGHELTLINRGRYSMSHYEGVKEFAADRHNLAAIKALPLDEEYDAVIDFCAYTAEEVKGLVETLPCKFGRYIVLSTADVIDRKDGVRKDDDPLVSRNDQSTVDDYIYNKMLMEKQVKETCEAAGIDYTIMRPSFIFGPYNYAPRESFFIKLICTGQRVPMPMDASGKFQMVYVKDVADAILLAAAKPEAANRSYILTGPDVLDYGSFISTLAKVSDRQFELDTVTVRQIEDQRIPVPFPLYLQESEVFDGSRIVNELGFSYSDFEDSMKKTFVAFRSVYCN